jgi:hypothetical protein
MVRYTSGSRVFGRGEADPGIWLQGNRSRYRS